MSNKSISAAMDCKRSLIERKSLNVENATNDLDLALNVLSDAVDDLTNQLSPLLAPEPPQSLGEARQTGDSDLAERILSNASSVRYKAAAIRELIDRL